MGVVQRVKYSDHGALLNGLVPRSLDGVHSALGVVVLETRVPQLQFALLGHSQHLATILGDGHGNHDAIRRVHAGAVHDVGHQRQPLQVVHRLQHQTWNPNSETAGTLRLLHRPLGLHHAPKRKGRVRLHHGPGDGHAVEGVVQRARGVQPPDTYAPGDHSPGARAHDHALEPLARQHDVGAPRRGVRHGQLAVHGPLPRTATSRGPDGQRPVHEDEPPREARHEHTLASQRISVTLGRNHEHCRWDLLLLLGRVHYSVAQHHQRHLGMLPYAVSM
mmetsp:Transcript_1517/g.3193  ORF Transcript_1517/g.3193 Transcript_1517/m.3193 type:complete len:276 (-) Transcript_1517:3047-3874(-)